MIKTIFVVFLCTLLSTAAAAAEPFNISVCTSCHGVDGRGNEGLQAPRLAGLEPWYLQRQLENFRGEIRGVHAQDTQGISMQAMAAGLSDEAIAEILEQVASWDAIATEHTLQGDTLRGRNFYSSCALCHGANGEGNESMGAPALAGQNDWYLLTQLENFMAGYRGADPADTYGAQMRTMVNTLRNESGILNVVSYINTLPR